MPIKGLKQKHKKEKHLEMKNSKKKNTKTLLAYKRTKPLTGSPHFELANFSHQF